MRPPWDMLAYLVPWTWLQALNNLHDVTTIAGDLHSRTRSLQFPLQQHSLCAGSPAALLQRLPLPETVVLAVVSAAQSNDIYDQVSSLDSMHASSRDAICNAWGISESIDAPV